MGLDSRNETGIERYLIFGVDGPSVIRAQISNATGRVRLCLWKGNLVEQRQCQSMGNGVLEHAVFDAGSTSWTLTLISANQQTMPSVDLALDFNATSPSVDFVNFRFQGVPLPNYNGITASVDALNGGDLVISGAFDGVQEHVYRVQISEAGVGVVKDETGAGVPVNSFTVTHEVTAQTSYLISATNPNPASEPGPVFVRVTISWP